jgi:transposase
LYSGSPPLAKTRPPYTPEFRRQMVQRVRALAGGVAQEFEPTAQSIRHWVGQAECDAGRGGNGLTTAEQALRKRGAHALKHFSHAIGLLLSFNRGRRRERVSAGSGLRRVGGRNGLRRVVAAGAGLRRVNGRDRP